MKKSITKLDKYLRATKTRASAIAEAVGVSRPYITDLRYGRRKPSLYVALRIEGATGGSVGPGDWKE